MSKLNNYIYSKYNKLSTLVLLKDMIELIKIANKRNKINSLIHVGGHIGQEVGFYKSLNLKKVIYFEPVKGIC